jgi:hypothetical protein
MIPRFVRVREGEGEKGSRTQGRTPCNHPPPVCGHFFPAATFARNFLVAWS